MPVYDLVIIGGGPAGLAAGIYGARAKLKTVILEKSVVGGQAFTTREIVNYPGFFSGTTGPDLMATMADHAKGFGAEIIKEEVVEVELEGEEKRIKTKKGNQYQAKAVIIATGSQPRSLNIPGERELRGKGVSYCATCDAEFYEDLPVVVVGNGDAAIEEAMYITKYASKVTVIVIHDEGIVDCNRASAEKAFKNEKIEFVWN
ncbi:MAG: FAD-dependent oxidoreductase, partial [Firmicutes bacterium]|nr:FAD-dependent oxidoreductase [Bacillota bacterium]